MIPTSLLSDIAHLIILFDFLENVTYTFHMVKFVNGVFLDFQSNFHQCRHECLLPKLCGKCIKRTLPSWIQHWSLVGRLRLKNRQILQSMTRL